MGKLEISLLGGFDLALDGRPLNSFVSDKGRALVAYLAIESEHPHRRSNLANLLWTNQTEAISRANLRQTLHRMLQALGNGSIHPPYFLITYQDIQFNVESDFWLDVAEFKRLLSTYPKHHAQGSGMCDSCLANLQAAIDIYRGDMLSGFAFPGCSDFEWWLTCRQEEFHRQAIECLKTLVAHYEQERDFPHAVRYAQRAIELEPWSELLHRQKMVLLARSNQRIAALRQYEWCRKILAEELGVAPSREITTLFNQIKSGTFHPN